MTTTKQTTSTLTTVTETVDTVLDNKYTVKTTVSDGEITRQLWLPVKPIAETHDVDYEPNNVTFTYYKDVSHLYSGVAINSSAFDYGKVKPSFVSIDDLDSFTEFDNVLCVRVSCDGNVYKINERKPIALKRRQDYIGSFNAGTEEDLEHIMKVLREMSEVSNPTIIEIPWYNCGDDKKCAIEFDYVYSTKKGFVKYINSLLEECDYLYEH